MRIEIEKIVKEYFELKEKIKELEKRRSELKEVIFSVFDSKHTNELYAEDIRIYRVNHPKKSWDESALKSILAPKGLWESVLGVDNKKVRDLINNRVISEYEVENAMIKSDIWYTYAERVSKDRYVKSPNCTSREKKNIGTKRLVITDLSRMKRERVCIFGIDENKNPIRPVISYSGVREGYLFDEEGNQIIKPFAEVEFDFLHPSPKPPHTEDWEINTMYKPRLMRNLSEDERKVFLEEVLDGSVKEIFGAVIHENRYINPGEGERSLGTVKVKEVLDVNYSMKEEGKYKYRLKFLDVAGDAYDLPVTDCAFRRYCDHERIQNQKSMGLIGVELQRRFNQSEIYLRVGLTRLFKDVHWLQISGVHTFPDYRV